MYLYVGFDYTYIDVNALAQRIKYFLASHVWSQAVAGARTYGTDSPAMYVCMYVLMYVIIDVYMSYFSFQPVLHDWCNKRHGMCYSVCGMMHIK